MTRIEEIWHSIRSESAGAAMPEDGWILVRIDPSHPFDVYAGMDRTDCVMLAIGISFRPPSVDADTGALEYVRQQRANGQWIMGLRLAGAGLDAVFGRLCQDLVDAAAGVATETALVALFRERLLLWKRLFRDGASGLLQKFQIKGLIAELLTLEGFVSESRSDLIEPLLAWTGPAGSSQDFLFSRHAVEVKAVSPNTAAVSISSLKQLDAPVPLTLQVLVLRESSTSEPEALTLPLLVCRIENTLSSVAGAAPLFRKRLLEAGYVEHDHYETVAFSHLETRLYHVGEGFPRIVVATVPAGIPEVSYNILFSSIIQFLNVPSPHAA